ncbi:MAG: fumarylacetoacetate hydrolase family protein [Actinomycetota bacterium]
MRFVTVRTPDGTRAGRLQDDVVELLPFADVGAMLAEPGWREPAAVNRGVQIAFAEADLAPLVPRPSKIVCLGLNYRAHIEEMGRELPTHPTIFAKYAVSLIGARDPIVLPPESQAVDWEVELAFVVGARARRVRAADAAPVVAGFTVFNDVSMRDWQMRTLQFLQGKTFERSTPIGPALVTLDEVPGGIGADLEIACEVDGAQMQKARTSDLLFPPSVLVEYLSTIMTLEPGDIVATGTPSGVGAGRNPPVFLKPGQTVRTTIEGVGELINPTVAEAV